MQQARSVKGFIRDKLLRLRGTFLSRASSRHAGRLVKSRRPQVPVLADPSNLARDVPDNDGAHLGVAFVETDIPARLDALSWGRFHTLIVFALGITWILDGLEVTLAGSLSGALKQSATLHFTNSDIGFASSAYLAGSVLGAVFFGWLTDRLGRKKLFFITLSLYLLATTATAFAWDAWSFAIFRLLTGAGIGGEYTAINSTIQEFTPARYRGYTDLVINGSFWVGAAIGALAAVTLLDPAVAGPEYGWRLAFLIGAMLGLVVFAMRLWIPESPRWLIIHGQLRTAETIMAHIESRSAKGGESIAATGQPLVRLRPRTHTPLLEVWRTLFRSYRQRTLVGIVLMSSQAFFYNAIFFTYPLILTDFFGVEAQSIGWYLLPFAAGNFLGPLLLGRLFDTIGRRQMIAFTYAMSGILLVGTGIIFLQGWVSAAGQTLAWTVTFFFASAAASSAYLTVSEVFPLEIRALAIAFFFAFGTAVGGVAGPWFFSSLVDSHSRASVFYGYLAGAVLMLAAAAIAWRFAPAAERRSLESVARPLAFSS
jgi:MFS family permease